MPNKIYGYPSGGEINSQRLGNFIRENSKQVITEWSSFARTLMPAATDVTPLALSDHIAALLAFIANDLESPQTDAEQVKKSQGHGPKEGGKTRSAAEIHAALRLAGGFSIDQMVSEYRALRASVTKLWTVQSEKHDDTDLKDLTRFNEAIDQAMTESISHYTKKLDYSRNMFLGILGHDLRNPIGAASMSAQLLISLGGLDPKQRSLANQIVDVTARGMQIMNDLLDLTRAGFGSELTVIKRPMDMGIVGRQLVDEMQVFYTGRQIKLEICGNMQGEWDRARIGQVFSNLIGNAIQYSFENTPVRVSVTGGQDEIVLSVHNDGFPIPPHKLGGIFDALNRGNQETDKQLAGTANLGLGLYITKNIVASHGGSISVTSSEKDGTRFTAKLPYH